MGSLVVGDHVFSFCKIAISAVTVLIVMVVAAHALECPSMPEQTRKDWEVEVKTAIGKIGPARGADLEARTKAVTKDLMGKLPEANKVYLEQMMFAAYCSAVRDDKTISETEKGNRIKAYNNEVRRTLHGQQGQPQAPRSKEQKGDAPGPKISLIGALPLHLWDKIPGPDPNSRGFIDHRLGLVLKLRNNKNFPARVDVAVIEGCVGIPAWIAREMLIAGETLPEPLVWDKTLGEIQKKTIQAIRASGTIRQDSRDVPAQGTGYVGVLFSLPPGRTGAYIHVAESASIKGNCNAIKNPSTQPTIATAS